MPIPEDDAAPLRLGHIVYSNCFPVHARLLDEPAAGDPTLVEGVPSTLNRLLSEGGIQVAPSSSIEYAYHADRYRLLPDLVIGSRGPVRSILFLSDRAPWELEGELVAIPTASATSVVLLRILLSERWKVKTRFLWFDQATEDPFVAGAAAALFIGDVALAPGLRPDLRVRLDLGAEWWEQTGLPFAFAVWQTSTPERTGELRALHSLLVESREFGLRQRSALAERYSARFRMDARSLDRYWADLSFELDDDMVRGLGEFYRLAAAIGEIPRAPELRWIG
jgi:chorismate dehydratase